MSKAETVLKEGIDLYNKRVSDYKKFTLSEYECAMFVGFMEDYARLQIEADRERVAEKATLIVTGKGDNKPLSIGQLSWIADDGDHITINKESILNLPIKLD